MKIALPRPTLAASLENTVKDFSASALLDRLLHAHLVRPRDWDHLPGDVQESLRRLPDLKSVLGHLVKNHLLTAYQATRLNEGGIDALILGNYRILDILGAGGMGVVLKAEHHLLGKPVAIKLLTGSPLQIPTTHMRFLNEIWALGQLHHPNIVAALDAGEVAAEAHGSTQCYLAMEYVPGDDLERLVQKHGPLDPGRACDLMHQVAGALAEAHRHQLVHRDIKPSNIRVTPEGQAKLLDFGVTRIVDRRLTTLGTVLGSIAYVAPEQAEAAGDVDIRADIYGLGATLYWCLTGQTPFPCQDNPTAELAARLVSPPPRLRNVRPELPGDLEQVVTTLMATRREDRPSTPEAAQKALAPFVKQRPAARQDHGPAPQLAAMPAQADEVIAIAEETPRDTHRILIVDDEAANRHLWRIALEAVGLTCAEAANGQQALDIIQNLPFDLVVLDIDMPAVFGTEVLRRLREKPPAPHLKIIMASGRVSSDDLAEMMMAGADDYLSKPFSATQLRARVQAALRLKDAQVRSDTLFRSLLTLNHDLEQNLNLRDSDLVHARNALVLALAELVAYRDTETGSHLMRLQRYCRCLAEKASVTPSYAGVIDAHFVDMLECCAPLHDIGKAGVPDHILLKPGQLSMEERIIMQSHTTIGANILAKVAREHGFARTFLKMATDITRHHHERFDGAGYPDRLVGDAIPLSARIVAIGDVYDAMRSRRVYKPAISHKEVVRIMLNDSCGHFDPSLLVIFQQCADRFEQLYQELVD